LCCCAQTEVTVVPYLIHRDPSLWPEPQRFDPERFTKENSKARHAFAYLPFSGGLRRYHCVVYRVLFFTVCVVCRVSCVVCAVANCD
jgi:hypothetical protein